MPRKTVAKEQIFSPSFDQKIIKLTVLFFALSTTLFIVGIFKLNRISNTMPFSQSRDYIVFEKNTRSGNTCEPSVPCTESLQVYRSGKVLGLGSKMYVDVLSPKQLEKFIAAIDKSGILNKDCSENAEVVSYQDYTIKLGVEVKRSSSTACKAELDQIEAQIYQ